MIKWGLSPPLSGVCPSPNWRRRGWAGPHNFPHGTDRPCSPTLTPHQSRKDETPPALAIHQRLCAVGTAVGVGWVMANLKRLCFRSAGCTVSVCFIFLISVTEDSLASFSCLIQSCHSDLPCGRTSSELGLSVSDVLEEVCSWSGGHPRSSPSLSSPALVAGCKRNNMQWISKLVSAHSSNVSVPLIFLTFQWVDWWAARDTAPSPAHLGTASQEHPPVWLTPPPAAPQSWGALASSWPTPQWSESPSHLLHLGGTTGKFNCQSSKRKDGSWSAASLLHVGHHHQMIALLCKV